MGIFRKPLSLSDRVMIEVRLRDLWGVGRIAASLCRSAGTISSEIKRHGDVAGYLAEEAGAQTAASRRLSGRRARLGTDGALFGEVRRLLGLGWSPEQISGRRKRIEKGREQQSGLQVPHEAIYVARAHTGMAGVYGAVIAVGTIPPGDAIMLLPSG